MLFQTLDLICAIYLIQDHQFLHLLQGYCILVQIIKNNLQIRALMRTGTKAMNSSSLLFYIVPASATDAEEAAMNRTGFALLGLAVLLWWQPTQSLNDLFKYFRS